MTSTIPAQADHLLRCNLTAISEQSDRPRRRRPAAAAAGLTPEVVADLDDDELRARLFPPPPAATAPVRPVPEWSEVHRELRRKGVTLQLLWSEYKGRHPEGYQYTQFVARYRSWEGALDPVLRQEHRAGEPVFVDYAGHTVPIVDREADEVRQAQLFIGVLGASSYIFADQIVPATAKPSALLTNASATLLQRRKTRPVTRATARKRPLGSACSRSRGSQDTKLRSAAGSGMHSKIQLIKHRARAYRNRETFRTAILFHCGGLSMNPC